MTHLLDSLGWALLHSFWQGGLAFCLVVIFRNVWKDAKPALRCGVQLLALIGCFAAFLATFALYMSSAIEPSTLAANMAPGQATPATPSTLQTGLSQTAAGLNLPTNPAAYTSLLGMIWCLGFAVMALRYSGAYILTRRLRRLGLSDVSYQWENRFRTLVLNAGLPETVRLFISDRVSGPLTIGFFKPLVLVPAGFLTRLPSDQVEAILLHELAHIRRYDYLINLVQTAIKTVFFFHPAIHYISRQIDIDREQACDDLAVAQSRDPQALARGLAALQLQLPQPSFAMAAKGADMPLLGRLKRLAGVAPQQRRPEHLMMSLLTSLLIGGIYLGTTGAANAHPEKSDEAYEHAKAAKHNYRFETKRLNGKSVTVKITEDGRRWVMADGHWVDVDKSPEVLNRLPEVPQPPAPPKYKSLGGLEKAGKYNPNDLGFDDKMDQFQIDMDYFEASMERYTDEMNGANDRDIERAVKKAEWEAERSEHEAERMAALMEAARERADHPHDREEDMREQKEEMRERAQEQRERAEEQVERQREWAENHAEEQRQRAQEHAERQRERMQEHAEHQREWAEDQAEHAREQAEKQAEYVRKRAEKQAEQQREWAEEQAERQREHAEEQAEHQRERAKHQKKHADKTEAKYNALREALYVQLLKDGLIASRQEKVTFRYKDNHWVANGVRVPSVTEGNYCQIMADMGINKSTLTKLEISKKSTHLVTTSKDGKDRQSHKITVGEFEHKTKVKHKHKDGSVQDSSQQAQALPYKTEQHANPVMPTMPVSPTLPINFETQAPVFVMPTMNARLSARYGMSSSLWPETHQGIDLAAKTGTPVFAAADGKVKLLTTEDAWGHRIILEHNDGFQTLYGHLNSFNVKPGQTVKAGDVIAGVGSTGKSTGPHLHFEIRKDGETLDPENLIF